MNKEKLKKLILSLQSRLAIPSGGRVAIHNEKQLELKLRMYQELHDCFDDQSTHENQYKIKLPNGVLVDGCEHGFPWGCAGRTCDCKNA